MIEFSIDPPSGHAESCLDIKFVLKLSKNDSAEIEIFNDTSGDKLEILSVSKGTIYNESTLIVRKTNFVEGFFNLFNKDKMNFNLSGLTQVKLRCVVKITTDGETSHEESSALFYNESQSLDASIIPFDLILVNNEINLSKNDPLRMHIVCDSEKKFELAIKSVDSDQNICSFEVVTLKGKTNITIPSELIWSDLEYNKYYNRKYQIFWVKFEGITHMKFLNRKYIPISETQLTFIGREMSPKAQNRVGPVGLDLSQDFVLSHRYFVPTWKEYTSLGALSANNRTSSEQNISKIRFLHEIQSLEETAAKDVRTMSDQTRGDIINRRQEVSQLLQARNNVQVDPRQRLLISAYKKAYSQRLPVPRTDKSFVQYPSVQSQQPVVHNMSSQKKQGGCGCSRKKNA